MRRYHNGYQPKSMNAFNETGFYKHLAPTALAIVVAILFYSHTAFAQRRTPATISSPRSVLGFNPGDDRTIAARVPTV